MIGTLQYLNALEFGAMRTDKALAIENLRLFLMTLVVMHHTACADRAPGYGMIMKLYLISHFLPS